MRAAIIFLSISLLCAQGEKCTVKGTVVNAKTKEPVKKAQVMLSRTDSPEAPRSGATTDGAGQFEVTNLDPGQYNILAYKDGFTQGPKHPADPSPVLTLTAGQTVKDLVFHLRPTAVIAGRVVDEDGEPMLRVQIQAMRYQYAQGARQIVPSGYASTDDQGYYRLHSLPAGRYYVRATYMGMPIQLAASGGAGSSAPSQEEGYAPVYYPGVSDATQAASIQLREGDERTTVDFRLTPVHTVRVRGRISPLPLHPREVNVMLAARESDGLMPTVGRGTSPVNEKGVFEVRGVAPGAYTLIAMWNREGNQLTARQPVEVGNTNVDGIELVLKPGVELKGRVRVESGGNPDLKLDSMRVRLAPDQPTPFGGGAGVAVETDGSFTLRNLAEGVYRVSLFPLPQDCYLKAATYGDTDAIEKGLSVGEAPGALEMVLSPNAGQVDGMVTADDKPAIGATVVLVPQAKRSDLYQQTATDQYGHFTIRGVAPGKYQLYAWDNLERGAYQDPEFLEAYKDRAKTVTVEEKGRVTQDLPLLHAPAE